MELPNRKSREEDDVDFASEETNDVRSSLQGPLREGGHRAEDAGFLGGGGPSSGSPSLTASYAIFLISASVFVIRLTLS